MAERSTEEAAVESLRVSAELRAGLSLVPENIRIGVAALLLSERAFMLGQPEFAEAAVQVEEIVDLLLGDAEAGACAVEDGDERDGGYIFVSDFMVWFTRDENGEITGIKLGRHQGALAPKA